MRVLLTLAFVFICFSGPALAQQNTGDTVTDDDIKSALHGGGTPVSSKPREYAPAPKPSDDEEETTTPEEQSDVQPVTQGAATTAPAPSPSQSKNSLMDLKAAQDEVEADEGAPALQAIGEGVKTSCPSREIALTVKMPDLTKMYRSDGDTSQARKCEDTFQRLPDSCAEDTPCTVCEKAVKAYTDACMYVGNSMGLEETTGINAATSERAPQPVNRIPFHQGTH